MTEESANLPEDEISITQAGKINTQYPVSLVDPMVNEEALSGNQGYGTSASFT